MPTRCRRGVGHSRPRGRQGHERAGPGYVLVSILSSTPAQEDPMAATAPSVAPIATDDIRWRRLVLAAWVFLVGSAVHVVAPLRRGQTSVTESLYVAGTLALVLQVVIITLVLPRHRWAPFVATAGGVGLAIGFAAAH